MLLYIDLRLIKADNEMDGGRRGSCMRGLIVTKASSHAVHHQELPRGTILGVEVDWYSGRYIDRPKLL